MADTRLYDLLGVVKGASDNEIRKAYKKLSKEYHPSRRPDAGEILKEITVAYEVLSDPKKRAIYDNYGLTALQEQTDIHCRFPHPFSEMSESNSQFGMPGPSYLWNERKGDDSIHYLKLPLEDLYNGRLVVLKVERSVTCPSCQGKCIKTCTGCRGSGYKVTFCQKFPGVTQQVNTYCDECNATGEITIKKNQCSVCNGKSTIKEIKPLEIKVEKGMKDKDKLTFKGGGNEGPGLVPGNVVVIIQEKPHEIFQRRGDNLLMNHTLSLTEALCGFTIVFKHLDGRDLFIKSRSGEVIQPGDVKKINNEGMPCYKNSSQKGHLFIKFNVKFPNNHFVDEATLKDLKNLLPDYKHETIPSGENVEEVNLYNYIPEEHVDRQFKPETDDSDEDLPGLGLQCAHQ